MIRQQNMIHRNGTGGSREPSCKSFDFVTVMIMTGICSLLPDYGGFNNSDFVANGFDIHNSLDHSRLCGHGGVCRSVLTTVGYFFLKTREIAA